MKRYAEVLLMTAAFGASWAPSIPVGLLAHTQSALKILDVPQSGSLGGVTSSRNSSGQYKRARAIPTNPNTPAQSRARASLSDLSAGWRGLTALQQTSWNAFGQSFTVVNSLGTTIHLTGIQCYVKVNTVNLLNGAAIVTTPPALPAFLACTVTGVTAVSATPLIELQGANPVTGTLFMIYSSPQVSAGVSYMGNYRWIQTSQTFTSGNMSIQTAWAAKFGSLIAGKKIFIKVVQSQAGMQDNGTIFTCLVS
jgi:hypothetical protein